MRFTVSLLFTAACTTFLVPFTAGSTRSFWGSWTSLCRNTSRHEREGTALSMCLSVRTLGRANQVLN